MLEKNFKKIILDYALITLGSVIYSLAFVLFFQPNDLALGGFTGLCQIINHYIPALPIGVLVFVLNIPLMIIGFKKEGFKLLFSSFYAIFLSSLLIDSISAILSFKKTEPLLACIFGSILLGLSLGIMMNKNATTGGTELLARLIKYKNHSLSIGKVCLIIDVIIISLYSLAFNNFDKLLYGIISMYISSKVMDTVVYGSSNGKLAYIISDKNDEIMDVLLRCGFGVTMLSGKGGWTGNDKKILLCTARKNKIPFVKKTVLSFDPDKAFIIVCDAIDVFGEGFGNYSSIGL